VRIEAGNLFLQQALAAVMMELGTAGNVAANYCQVYNYNSSVGNPTSCALPTQGTGNNGKLMGFYLFEGHSPHRTTR
jgi:hypothetical protein